MISQDYEGVLKIDYENPVVKYRGQNLRKLYNQILPDTSIETYILIDLFYTLYLPYALIRNEVPLKKQKWKKLLETLRKDPLMQIIRSRTILNTDNATLSTLSLALKLAKTLRETADKIRPQSRRLGETGYGHVTSPRMMERPLAIMDEQTIASIMKETLRDLERYITLKGTVRQGYKVNYRQEYVTCRYMARIIKVLENKDAKRVLDTYMKIIMKSRIMQSEELVESSRGIIEGITLGNDIERIVISELLLPDDLFFVKFAEGSLLIYRKVMLREKKPILILIDKSSSMEGEKTVIARVLTLLLIKKFINEGRRVYVRFFTDSLYKPLTLEPSKTLDEMISLLPYVLTAACYGETDIDYAIIASINNIQKGIMKDVNHIILVTDGADDIEENILKHYLEKANMKLYTILIKGRNEALEKVSNRFIRINKIDELEKLT